MMPHPKHHGLYKFVTNDTDEIIYIGKTNNNIKSRIADHIRGKGLDEKFNAYKDKYKIYVSLLPNAVETDILERALINKYKPVLNVTDNQYGMSDLIHVDEPEWHEYKEVFPDTTKPLEQVKTVKLQKQVKSNALLRKRIFIGHVSGYDYYISNTYKYKDNIHKVEKQYFESPDEAIGYIKHILNLVETYGELDSKGQSYLVQAKDGQQLDRLWQQEHDNGMGPVLLGVKRNISSDICPIIKGYKEIGEILVQYRITKDAIDLLTAIA